MSKYLLLLVSVLSISVSPLFSQALVLPDPLLCTDGTKVTTSQLWESKRRTETLNIFQKQVYGIPTVGKPTNLRFKVVEENKNAMGGTATLRRVDIWYANNARTDSLRIQLIMFIPNTNKKPYSAFLLINSRSESNTDPTRATKSDFWPAEAVIARGYALTAFHVSGVDPDVRNNFTDGVHRVFDGGRRVSSESWGMLQAWAWGARRVMDYFETDADINQSRVAVIGHSRGGKAALVTGAVDQRFYMIGSNCSGNSGAKISRRLVGEDLKKIVGTFPDWFCSNYAQYVGKENTLPIDQHQLIALQAPRPVYVVSASNDLNADPEGEFLSLVHGLPVYKLYGKNGLGTTTWPKVNTPIHGDMMAYHLREGDHNLTRYDWDRYMDYFDKLTKTTATKNGVQAFSYRVKTNAVDFSGLKISSLASIPTIQKANSTNVFSISGKILGKVAVMSR